MLKDKFKLAAEKGFSFGEYRELAEKLLSEGKTTGETQTKELVDYTKLNITRMNRITKTTTVTDELKKELSAVNKKWIWLVLAEAWCGDVANVLPVLAKISDESGNIEMKIILRDENPEIMNAYLTNGGRSIPKLICLDAETLEELGNWGPRPSELQNFVVEYKKMDGFNIEELKKEIQLWYAQDKTMSIQNEILEEVRKWRKS
jgi:hypothetical protein